jgi:hypothetical protein
VIRNICVPRTGESIMRALRLGLATLLTTLVTTPVMAAVVLTNHYGVALDTGLRQFDANFPAQTIAGDGTITGSTVTDTSGRMFVPAFNPAYGVLVSQAGVVAFTGYPFEATFSVEGATDTIGDQVVAHEDVAGTVQMFVNGASVASTPFSVALNPSCTASNNGFTVILCSDQEKQAAFMGGAPVAIKSGDVVSFQYTMSQTDISCEVLPIGGGTPGVCIEGNTGITDLSNINDPQWQGTLEVTYDYVPEPGSMGILGLGFAALVGARRYRLRT